MRRLRFSPDGRTLASASDDGSARLWDVFGGTCRAVLRRHWDEVYALAFSPDGTRLASASGDSTIRIWDTRPLHERFRARANMESLRAQLTPRVRELLATSPDPAGATAALRNAPDLDAPAREAALQALLRLGH